MINMMNMLILILPIHKHSRIFPFFGVFFCFFLLCFVFFKISVEFIPSYVAFFFAAIVNRPDHTSSFSTMELFMYMKAIEFCALQHYLTHFWVPEILVGIFCFPLLNLILVTKQVRMIFNLYPFNLFLLPNSSG